MPPLRPEILSWTALLGRWMDFAAASLAIPEEADGDRWRASVAPVISLQAVTFALGDLERLDMEDRPYARDTAAVLIRDAAEALGRIWDRAARPALIEEIVRDAPLALEAAVFVGAIELVYAPAGAEEPMVMPEVPIPNVRGTLAVMQPGTLVMPGEPVAWWVERDGAPIEDALDGCSRRTGGVARQVYRQFGEDGSIVRDVVVPVLADPVPGMPLLVPLSRDGEPIGRFTLDAVEWEKRQRDGLRAALVPVVDAEVS